MKLYLEKESLGAAKIFAAAEITNINVQAIFINSAAEFQGLVPSYNGPKVLPILELSENTFLFSSNSATRYILNSGIKDKKRQSGEEAHLDSYLEWENASLRPAVERLETSTDSTSLTPDLHRLLSEQEKRLSQAASDKTCSAGDLAVWFTLYPILKQSSPLRSEIKKYQKLCCWFDNLNSKQYIKTALQRVCSTVEQLNMSSVTEVIPEAELEAAATAFLEGSQTLPLPKPVQHPILPIEGERNYLITSALPYVNNVPHLGNIIGCVLSADIFARYCRLRNYNVLYICGTDEYGTATETKAIEENLTPQELCDKYNRLHTAIYQSFNISFDYFGRTTTPKQTEIAQDIFWKLYNNDYVVKDSIEQLHCPSCNRFLADRFVEGTCPLCGYEEARGDQCDKCGKLINAVELKEPKCKLCKATPTVKSSNHLFVDLPKLEPLLSQHLEKAFASGLWTSNAKTITNTWIRDGLKPRCISRDLKWGVQVPLEGYTDKVFYVWFDAPIGYISITANYTDQWQQWWKNPKTVELFNFMAKDNVPFHSVIFPCCLLGAKDNWTVINHLSATEYLNYESGKFSKSRGVGVFGNDAVETGISMDIWRFYLLYVRPENQDSSFSWDDFMLKNNGEFLNNLGNFINRALMFISNNFEGRVQRLDLLKEDIELLAQVTRELQGYIDNLEKIRLRDGIKNILAISALGNQYLQSQKPWVLVKGDSQQRARCGTVVSVAANLACLLSTILLPYMPSAAETIQQQLNAPATCNVITQRFVCCLKEGHQIGQPKPLFEKMESSKLKDLKKRFVGVQQPQSKDKVEAVKVFDETELAELMKRLDTQASRVRQLKSDKAEKSVIDGEVNVLLELKRQLADIQGTPTSSTDKKKGKKK